jgi:hypothetical protein
LVDFSGVSIIRGDELHLRIEFCGRLSESDAHTARVVRFVENGLGAARVMIRVYHDILGAHVRFEVMQMMRLMLTVDVAAARVAGQQIDLLLMKEHLLLMLREVLVLRTSLEWLLLLLDVIRGLFFTGEHGSRGIFAERSSDRVVFAFFSVQVIFDVILNYRAVVKQKVYTFI